MHSVFKVYTLVNNIYYVGGINKPYNVVRHRNSHLLQMWFGHYYFICLYGQVQMPLKNFIGHSHIHYHDFLTTYTEKIPA